MKRNAFHEIEPEGKLPPKVRKETLANLGMLGLALDIIDLFVNRAGQTLVDSLSGESFPYGRVEMPPIQPLPDSDTDQSSLTND